MDTNRPNQPAGLPPSMRRPAHNHAPGRPAQHQQPAHRQAPPPPPPPPAPTPAHAPQQSPKPRNSIGKWIGIGVIAVVVLLIAGMGYKIWSGRYNELSVKPNSLQAVFLNNNMVYFGNLSQVDGEYVKLTNIFYLQQVPSQTASGTTTQQPATSANSQLSLTKLGGELHGPEDTMYINRREILFWENLKADGKVAQAIKDYQSKNK